MTSSLVGSEMCIRDSSCSLPLLQEGQKRAQRNYALHGVAWPKPRGNKPVSYTHLTLPTICSV
eukprot:3625282-Prorocentrum_lima.AAC.1